MAKASLGDTTAVAAIADPAAAEAASKRASKKRRRQEESPERAEALARYSAQGNLRSTEGGIGLKHAFSDRADETLAQAPLLHYRTRDGVDAGVVTAAEAAQRAGRSAAGGAGAGGAGAGAAGVTAGGEGESKVLSKSIFAVPLEKASEPAPLLHAPERKPVPMSKRSSLGSKWHNLPAQEITPELKKDLLVSGKEGEGQCGRGPQAREGKQQRRDRQTNRETDRKTDRQTDRQIFTTACPSRPLFKSSLAFLCRSCVTGPTWTPSASTRHVRSGRALCPASSRWELCRRQHTSASLHG